MTEPTESAPSYHDVYVTTAKIKRTRLFDLPYGYELTCTRTGGWRLWGPHDMQLADLLGPLPAPPPLNRGPLLIAGEYDKGLRVDIAGHVICDSLTKRQTTAS